MDYKKTIQTLADLVSAAFGFDVGVVDRTRVTIAGTGTFKKNVGLAVPRKCIAAKSILKNKPYVVENASYEADCYKCRLRNMCPYNMALLNPIVSNDLVEASIILLSTNKNQRHAMAKEINYLKENLEIISILIANNVLQRDFRCLFNGTNSSLAAFMNSLEEGIMTIGETGKIDYLNPAAENILGYKKIEIVGSDSNKIFADLGVKKILNKNKFVETGNKSSFCLEKHSGDKSIIYSVNKILDKDKLTGYVIRLKKDSTNKYFGPSLTKERDPFEKIIGNSISIKTPLREAKRIANSESAVLLLGETGTGKDLFARAIHEASIRRKGPFITLNCSALPDNLLESEMFGYEEGAFTGAKKGGKVGKFELAHEGTLFLDEIGDLPKILQAKLLRVIEDGVVEKIGSTNPEKVNVRIISATNQKLDEMITQGTFRKDLYYRLNVIPLNIPSLRERKEDILLLTDHFMSLFSAKVGISPKILGPEVENLFLNYSWSGNVRELKNVIEYLVQISQDNVITVDALPQSMRDFYYSKKYTENNREPLPFASDLQLLERSAIEEAIKRCGSSTAGKKRVAQNLGISLTTLYRRLNSYNINCNS